MTASDWWEPRVAIQYVQAIRQCDRAGALIILAELAGLEKVGARAERVEEVDGKLRRIPGDGEPIPPLAFREGLSWFLDMRGEEIYSADGRGYFCINFNREQLCREIPVSTISGKKPGRSKGSGLHTLDEPLVSEMHDLITSGKASSPSAAATMVVSRARGGGDEESRKRRLVRRYKIIHGV